MPLHHGRSQLWPAPLHLSCLSPAYHSHQPYVPHAHVLTTRHPTSTLTVPLPHPGLPMPQGPPAPGCCFSWMQCNSMCHSSSSMPWHLQHAIASCQTPVHQPSLQALQELLLVWPWTLSQMSFSGTPASSRLCMSTPLMWALLAFRAGSGLVRTSHMCSTQPRQVVAMVVMQTCPVAMETTATTR